MTNKTSSKKTLYTLLLLIPVAAFMLIKFLFSNPGNQVAYITETARKASIELTVLADGNIKAYKMVNVGAQVSGQIKSLHVALGDKVKKDQLVAEIDDLTQQNTLKEAEANLKNLMAQHAAKQFSLKNAQINFNRQKSLYSKKAGSKEEYDLSEVQLNIAKTDIDALDAQIAKAQISLDTAQLNLGYTKITAPMDGVVVAMPVEEGQTVNSVQTAPTIIKVAQLDIMTIEAQISEADVIKIKPGMQTYFTILGEPDKKHFAKLRSIEPAPTSIILDSLTSSSSNDVAIYYNGILDVPNSDNQLRISMTAQVYIVLQQAENATIIPITALKKVNKTENTAIVEVLENDQPIERNVSLGINNNVNVQILSGIEVGESVIIGSFDSKNAKASVPSMRVRM